MKRLDVKSPTSEDVTERVAILKQTLNRFVLSFTRASVVATCAGALILIAIHAHPVTVPPPDRGHPIQCGEHTC